MPEAHAPETFFGLDVQVPRSKASGVGLGGPREQDRTMVEFYTEVGTVYQER
jgi:hypothetical protein